MKNFQEHPQSLLLTDSLNEVASGIVTTGELEMHRLAGDRYEPMTPNDRGHYPIVPMQVELGVWQGVYQNQSQQWLC